MDYSLDRTDEQFNTGENNKEFLPRVDAPEGQTDLANSRRFVAIHGENIRYCHPWGKWLVWDGCRWVVDETGAVENLAKHIADKIWHEAKTLNSNSTLKFAARSASNAGIHAILSLAESDVPISVDEMDSNSWLLNCQNGTIDLRTGELREHRREDGITKLCQVEFDPNAKCPVFEKFLLDVFADDMEMISFLQRLLGYAISGSVAEQILPILWGAGSNGKSTLVDAITYCIGRDYCGTLPRSLLMVTNGERHPTELTTLHGRRLVIAHETDDGGRLSEALVKQLTGGDAITARGMRQDFWTFQPVHKILMLTNHRPRVRGTDFALWRRLRLVPFNVRFDGDKRDKTMPDRLKAESQGILAWLVRGCLEWQKTGLAEPSAVMAATAEYRSAEDVLAGFFEDCCILGNNLKCKATQLYETYKSWCERTGERTLTQRAFGEAMTTRGFERRASNGSWYVGIGIVAE